MSTNPLLLFFLNTLLLLFKKKKTKTRKFGCLNTSTVIAPPAPKKKTVLHPHFSHIHNSKLLLDKFKSPQQL